MTNEKASGSIRFAAGDKRLVVNVQADSANKTVPDGYKGFVENNGYVSIQASHFTRQTARALQQWKVVPDFGYTGNVLQVLPISINGRSVTNPDSIQRTGSFVEYDFYTFSRATPSVVVFTLPTQPVNNNFSVRYAISIDDGPLKIIDTRTFGRSEEWKQNVLRNRVEKKAEMPTLNAGKHNLKIYAVDPGVILDEIRIDLGGLKKAYSPINETKIKL